MMLWYIPVEGHASEAGGDVMSADTPDDDAPERSGLCIRPARGEEAAALSALALRSKAQWGYDAVFLAMCRDDLTMSGDDIERGLVFVLEDDDHVVGFYSLWGVGDEALLTALFVEPQDIGRGYGRRLWDHGVRTARHVGYAVLTLHSDPHAEGFYRAMGAQRVGVVPSTVFSDRLLPLMNFDLR